jgi:hypothetical protein
MAIPHRYSCCLAGVHVALERRLRVARYIAPRSTETSSLAKPDTFMSAPGAGLFKCTRATALTTANNAKIINE